MNGRKAALHNLGCKVNAYELQAMQELLEGAGYEIVPFTEKADVYVVNTCTVTNIADRKSRQMLHRAKKQNPQAIVVAAGCYAQTGADLLKDDSAVDILLGNDRKGMLLKVLEDFTGERESLVEKIAQSKAYEPLQISRTAEHARVFVKVTDGCNQFCTYCLIPYARGRVRSRHIPDVAAEVACLAQAGYREVVLTGIHLSSYGSDFGKTSEGNQEDLLALIRAVGEIPGITRIRLGSLEPSIITPAFVEGLRGVWQLCPHFHLSLQSGCDETLFRMNRRYRSKEYLEKCQQLREAFPDPALTTDVIVGFPGETQVEFEQSYDFVSRVGFYETHIFPYSRRDGTRAAAMPGQVAEEVKKIRSEQMLALNTTRIEAYEKRRVGTKLSVLLEEEIEVGGVHYLLGHSREYVPVAVPRAEGHEPGDEVCLKATGFLKEHLLLGEE